MKFGKRYSSVVEMVEDTCGKKFARKLKRRIQNREIIKQLILLRIKSGLTQKDIAAKMKCTQQNVCRIENKPSDNGLSLNKIRAYAAAIGYKMEIKFEKVENVKISKN